MEITATPKALYLNMQTNTPFLNSVSLLSVAERNHLHHSDDGRGQGTYSSGQQA